MSASWAAAAVWWAKRLGAWPLSRRLLLYAGLAGLCLAAAAAERGIPLDQLRSGIAFSGRDVQSLQRDTLSNPSQLWLDQAAVAWQAPAGTSGKSCAACHGGAETLRGVAARFPKIHTALNRLVNLEDQIRHCRGQHQGAPVPAFESDELLGLTLLVTQASAGWPLRTDLSPALLPHWRAGEQAFQRRQGQLNLSCAQCHDARWGQRLYTDPLSQGHPNGYPVYRLEWQRPGSLERRLRSCLGSIRAELPPWGDLSLRQLSLYLNWRGTGLPIEVPAVRK